MVYAGGQYIPQSYNDQDPTTTFRGLGSCLYKGDGIIKLNFTKIAIVSNDPYVMGNASEYFKNYVFKTNNFPDYWDIDQFNSTEDLFSKVRRDETQPYCFGLNFIKDLRKKDNGTKDEIDINIEFSFNKGMIVDTNSPAYDEHVMSPDFASWGNWQSSGVVSLFPYLTEFIARYVQMNYQNITLEDQPQFMGDIQPLFYQSISYAPMYSQKYIKMNPQSSDALSRQYPFFFMIIQLIPFYYLTLKISSEKENKSREGMKMMGLTDGTYYLALFIFYFTIAFGTSAIVSIITTLFIFKKVNITLFMFFSMIYSMSFFGVALIITALLPTKRSSSVAATLFHIVSYYVSFTIWNSETHSVLQYILSLFPNTCMCQSIKQFFWQNLNTQNGAQWDQLNITHQGFSLMIGIIIMAVDFAGYLMLGIYLDQIVPSQFGVAKPWNFCCKRKRGNRGQEEENLFDSVVEEDINFERDSELNFEMVSDALKKQVGEKQCLEIKGLRKCFGKKIAVHNTNMTIYNGQIFALLGHNGAGKTTTLSMLSGLIQPSKGTAQINGIDIFQNMEDMRKILGVCPQHDVLFDFLTPKDHLRLFAAFKGVSKDQIEKEVHKMILDIGLTQQQDQLAKTLSGGQKRKLSVAIALIGGSKIVMLDEPTSGMDTTSRRKLWDMLKRNKKDRIIILTTHYMDEADILGDRIAIMAEGRVQCTGSSLFLKNRYGVGYNLVISKKTRGPNHLIDNFIQKNISNSKKMQEVSSEVQYQLPTTSSHQFKQFFQDFDKNLELLGIKSYGVGITTLEEVFLQIGHGKIDQAEKQSFVVEHRKRANSKTRKSTESLNDSYETIQKIDVALLEEEYCIANQESQILFPLHFYVLLKKRLLMQIRDSKTLSIDLVFPLLLIIIGLFLTSVQFYTENGPRVMDPTIIYPEPLNIYQNDQSKYGMYSKGLNEEQINEFFTDYIIANQSQWNFRGSLPIDFSNNYEMSYIKQNIKSFDESIFHQDTKGGVGTTYGQFYIQKLDKSSTMDRQTFVPDYEISLLLNSTSQSVNGVWGSYTAECFLRKYIVDMSKQTPYPMDAQYVFDNFKLSLTNRPFPLSKQFQGINRTFSGTNSALLMTIAWMMISDALLQMIIREKQKNIKHQIMVSGSSLPAYWLSNYFADVIFHALGGSIALLGIYMFDVSVPDIHYLFILIVFANPVFVYFITFFFEKDESGSLAINIIFFIFGIIAPISLSILQIMSYQMYSFSQTMRWIFYPIPIFSLTFGYISIINKDIIQYMIKSESGQDIKLQPFDREVAGPSYDFLLYSIPVYWFFIIIKESNLTEMVMRSKAPPKYKKIEEEVFQDEEAHEETPTERQIMSDEDFFSHIKQNMSIDEIEREEDHVESKEPKNLPVRVNRLRKTYGKVVAVDKITFGLEYGECFALLGVSGAGKTNCFKCLTGETKPTSGEVTINGHDVTTTSGFMKARKQIGYCPQFDCIFEGLTVREHLEIYAALKGIPSYIRKKLIDKQITEMDLTSFENVKVETLSGGNKRKVSVSIAMIGNPPIVFLDEPSTGVDPQAKRFMWDVISKISVLRKKSAVIITTHAMEEAEALCTKMGIMVSGNFKCFGSSQYIKDKYGTGYEIEFKIRQFKDQEINDSLAKHGYQDQETLNKKKCFDLLKKLGLTHIISLINPNQIGFEFHQAFAKNLEVNTNELMRWQFTESRGGKTLDFLDEKFKNFEVLEHYGSTWKLKVSRDKYSIGYLFGMMEDIKIAYEISEYSINQTTLEQIFNNFAQETEREKHTTFYNAKKRSFSSLKNSGNESITKNYY